MITINGNPIFESEKEILYRARDELYKMGIIRLKHIRPTFNNLMITCPVHSNGNESKPSCGVLTKARGDTEAGTFNCLACGKRGSFSELISLLFNRNDGGIFGSQWIINNFLTVGVGSRRELDIDSILEKPKPVIKNYVQEDELNNYRYIHPYMYERKLTLDVIDKFDVGYDKGFMLHEGYHPLECITFPVRDIHGRTLFVARRAIHQKLFNYPSGIDKPIYGVYELNMFGKPDEVIICESIINALTCWVYGKYAVALNGTGTSQQYEELRKLGCKKYILALDPDKAGNAGRYKLKKELSSRSLVTEYLLPYGKDINDLTLEEFLSLKEIFI